MDTDTVVTPVAEPVVTEPPAPTAAVRHWAVPPLDVLEQGGELRLVLSVPGVSPDGLTHTWHLRRGAAFSDGHPITSEDVVFSFKVAYDATLHPSIQDLLIVNDKPMEVSAPDSYTVVTKIVSPYAMINAAIGSLRIMPKHILESAYEKGDILKYTSGASQ